MFANWRKYMIIFLILPILACQFVNKINDSFQPKTDNASMLALTKVAEYIEVGMTLTARAKAPTALPSSTELPANTPQLSQTSPIFEPLSEGQANTTSTPALVAQLPSPTSTLPKQATISACHYEAFLDYETIPAGKLMPLNHKFTKLWRIRNTGTCNWDQGFDLMCINNCNLFGISGSTVLVNRVLRPKEQIEIQVAMQAPKDKKLINKTITATWMLRGAGKIFGIQPDGKGILSVSVKLID